jgi:DNA-directed RNA polymerase II subunit RPB9
MRSSNLLYPKEDPGTRTLSYVCKACHHIEPAEPSCTYRKELGVNVTETAGVTTDVANDPTAGRSRGIQAIELTIEQLPRSSTRCPKCKETEAVYFQSQQRGGDTTMVC